MDRQKHYGKVVTLSSVLLPVGALPILPIGLVMPHLHAFRSPFTAISVLLPYRIKNLENSIFFHFHKDCGIFWCVKISPTVSQSKLQIALMLMMLICSQATIYLSYIPSPLCLSHSPRKSLKQKLIITK